METANATLTLDAEQRRKLAQVYRYILSLSERRKVKAAEVYEVREPDTSAASSTPTQEAGGAET